MTTTEQNELNAWIAENVMGWQWWTFTAAENEHPYAGFNWCQLVPKNELWTSTMTKWNGVKVDTKPEGLPDETDLTVFKPTTAPAAAMEVLKACNEHINNRKYREVIGLTTLCGKPMLCYDPEQIAEHADTMELAICKFAKVLFTKPTP